MRKDIPGYPEYCVDDSGYVNRASIHDILKGKTWKHLTDY